MHPCKLERSVARIVMILGLAGWVGCASEVTDGGIATGSGGDGGSTSTTAQGSGSTGTGGPCAQDCSTVVTPPCLVALCNEGQFKGPIGVCTVVDAPSTTTCDDGLFCTVEDHCD